MKEIKTYYYHDSAIIFKHLSDDPVMQKFILNQRQEYNYDAWKPNFLFGFIKGNQTVFEYYYRNEGDEKMIDDEYECQFCFQIPGGQHYFNLEDKDLKNVCYFDESYFGCPACCINTMEFIKGKITGVKVSNKHWMIKAKVYYSCVDSLNNYGQPVKVEFSGRFINHNDRDCGNYLKGKYY